ncbi:MAG: MFS transporter [Lachnospiraceae bacterium]
MQQSSDKVTMKEKIAFGLANLGNIPIMTITGSFLLIFYTNIVGIDPAACATLFLVARIVDGLSDSFVGYILDHLPNTKWGHFRPQLVLGAILCSINFLLLWYGPLMAGSMKLLAAYVTYLLLGILFDIMDISLNSLLPVMTTDMKERTTLSTIKGTVYMIGLYGLSTAAPLMIGDASRKEGYLMLVIMVTIAVAVFSIIGAIGIKERVKPTEGAKYKIKDLFKIVAQRPIYTHFSEMLLTTTGMFIMNTVNTYYYAYIMGSLSMFSVASIVNMVALFPGMFITAALAEKIGKKRLYVAGMLICGLAPVLRIIGVVNVPLLLISSALAGFGQGVMTPHLYGMQADNTDYVELAIGQRAEAAIASLSSFVAKFAMGVGGAIPGYLLAWAGFSASAQVQSDTVNTTIIFSTLIFPAVFYVLGAIIIGMGYPLTKEKLAEQVEKLNNIHVQKTVIDSE